MVRWWDEYIGLPYEKNGYDCVDFIRQALKEKCCYDVPVPSEVVWRRTDAETVKKFGEDIVDPVEPGKERDFDVAVIRVLGSRRVLGSHLGLVGSVSGRTYIIHNLQGIGVSAILPTRLHCLQLELDGYYRFKTIATC